jgi:hypothetical protein
MSFCPRKTIAPCPLRKGRWTGGSLPKSLHPARLGRRRGAQRRQFARQRAERDHQLLPAGNPASVSPAHPAWTGEATNAILQPPKPQIEPSPRILDRATGRDLDLEAAD